MLSVLPPKTERKRGPSFSVQPARQTSPAPRQSAVSAASYSSGVRKAAGESVSALTPARTARSSAPGGYSCHRQVMGMW